MSYQKSELYFLVTLLVGMSIVTFFIFQPFLYALILGVIFATVFSPVHKILLSRLRGNKGLAALVTTIFVLVVIVVPVTLLSTQIFQEATSLYSSLIDNGGIAGLLKSIEDLVRSIGIPFMPTSALDFGQYVKQGLSFLLEHLGTIFSNVAKIIVGIIVLFIALYYLFKDGHELRKSVIALSPLSDVYDETIFRKLELAINSVVRGSISVALVQGVLTAIGLYIFGVPNPVLWGSVASVTALIPGVGTSLVLIPSILFLFFTGSEAGAVGLLIWGIVAVGLVDNVLGPKIVGKGAKLHPFLILLSILGGIGLFGPIGFLFGPLALALLFAFLEIYSTIRGARSK
ncbi:MAG: AI-2E family transporter [Minisyncoccia bacterium]